MIAEPPYHAQVWEYPLALWLGFVSLAHPVNIDVSQQALLWEIPSPLSTEWTPLLQNRIWYDNEGTFDILWIYYNAWWVNYEFKIPTKNKTFIKQNNFQLDDILSMLMAWSAVEGPMGCCVCIINSYSTLLNWPIVSLLFLYIYF